MPKVAFSPRAQRASRIRARVLEAAQHLLTERGVPNVTIDAVVERTGVARTTVYRHWPSRSELLAATIVSLGEPIEVPDTGTVRGDLLKLLLMRSHIVQSANWDQRLQALPGLMEAARHDPGLSAAVLQCANGNLKAVRDVLERGKARNEIHADQNLDTAADMLLGAIFIRRGYRAQPMTDKLITDVVDSVLRGISSSPGSPGLRAV